MRQEGLRTYFLLYLLSLLIVSCNNSRVSQSKKESNTFFMVMSDPQFGFFTNNHGFEKETKNLETAVAAANRLKPGFVVVCGDLVNQANASNTDQVAEYKRIMSSLDQRIPLYNVPGNHDLGMYPTTQTIQHYRQLFGKDYYSFQYKNLYGIVLNSMLILDSKESRPDYEEIQYNWLVSELKNAQIKGYSNIMVFMHIPVFLTQADEENLYYDGVQEKNIPIDKREKYLKLFHDYGVKAVFAGHLHQNFEGDYMGLRMITTGAIGRPLGNDPSGFRIVTVDDQGFTYPYYSLDSIPNP